MRSSSPLRFLLPAAVAGLLALFAVACGSSVNPNAPMPLSGTSNAAAGAPASSAGKVDVCHKAGGGFQLINVSGNALPAHLAHGDGQPNGDVPGTTDKIFGASCQVIQLQQYTVTLVSGAAGGTGSLDSTISYGRTSGGTGTAIILDTHPAYASIAGARWVSWATVSEYVWYLGWRTFGAPHAGDDITYNRAFTLPAGARNASLTGSFMADNEGNGFLNGAPIGGPANFGTPVSINATSGFVSGGNTLSFKVADWGGVSGLTFKATITYWAQ